MRRQLVTILLPVALLLPSAAIAGGVQAAPARASCPQAGYSHANNRCVVVPASGGFSMKIAGTNATVHGRGSGSTAGTAITFTKLPPPVRAKGGFGLRVRATGRFNPLSVSPGKLWTYSPSKNRLYAAKKIKVSGVYQVTR